MGQLGVFGVLLLWWWIFFKVRFCLDRGKILGTKALLLTSSPSDRITESQHGRGWQGPLWVTQPNPCPSRVTQSRLHSTAGRRGWNISREGDSTTSLGSLGQGSVTLRGKKFFFGFSWSFLCFRLCPLPLRARASVPSARGCWAQPWPFAAAMKDPVWGLHGSALRGQPRSAHAGEKDGAGRPQALGEV